jgi:hypothetical protein
MSSEATNSGFNANDEISSQQQQQQQLTGSNQPTANQYQFYGTHVHNQTGVQFASSLQTDGYHLHHNIDVPPICSLLMREAEAWRAILSLHGNVISSAQQIARCPDQTETATLVYDEGQLNSEAREAAYCSALSGLANQCDILFSEVLRLRNLRKARRSVEVECVNAVMRPHSNEVLAMGQTLASNGSLNVAATTAEVRTAVQGQRNQISQLRSFLEALKEGTSLPLPEGSKLVVGVQESDGDVHVRSLDEVLTAVLRDDRDVTETGLSRLLGSMFLGAENDSRKSDPKFLRRNATR